jgi:hypothetical protein
VVVSDLRRFARRLQRAFGDQPVVAVVERGALKGRLHVHLAVARFLSHKKMRRVWGHGHVWVGDDKGQNGKLPVRSLARYLSKYLAKQIEEDGEDQAHDRADGAHRYFVAQGFSPLCFRRTAFDLDTALTWLEGHYGHPDVALAWTAEGLPGVHGVYLAYDDAVIARWLSTA